MFCETFNAPAANANPNGRAGDLDPVLWGVSRASDRTNGGAQDFNVWHPSKNPCQSGEVLPPRDVRICNGKLFTSADDGNDHDIILSAYPRQPFDIAGRTGKATFDVSADSEGPHAAWPEWWWTDQPVPAPGSHIPGVDTYARNSLGVSFAKDDCGSNQTGVDQIMVTRNYAFTSLPINNLACVTRGSATSMNHVEIRVSASKVEVYMTEPGQSTLKLVGAVATTIPLTRGVIWVEQVHYNACKDNTQCDHAIAWDNVGFDGPRPYRDLTFDVKPSYTPKSGPTGQNQGWEAPVTLQAPGVTWAQTPTAAYVGMIFWVDSQTEPTVKVNGGPAHTLNLPTYQFGAWHTIAIPIAVTEVVNGTNTIAVTGAAGLIVSEVNLILIAAAP